MRNLALTFTLMLACAQLAQCGKKEEEAHKKHMAVLKVKANECLTDICKNDESFEDLKLLAHSKDQHQFDQRLRDMRHATPFNSKPACFKMVHEFGELTKETGYIGTISNLIHYGSTENVFHTIR